MKKILVCEDEAAIRDFVVINLVRGGYDVIEADCGEAALKKYDENGGNIDVAILDVMMPGTDGLSICNTIRKFSSVPILILTARDTTADYVTGITLGCDDYFTKPFSPVMLTMRVKAMFRRVELDKAIPYDEKLEYGDIEIMPKQKVAKCKGADLKLTITELNVLQYLMEKNGNAVSRDELLEKIWGYTSEVETRVTDDNIKRIRKKMNQQGSNVEIVTVWGYGFKLAIKE